MKYCDCGVKAHAKGLCSTCYSREYRKTHPDWESRVWRRQRSDPRKEILKAARRRARKRNRAFSITLSDIIIPNVCPILGIPLQIALKTPTEFSPSLDELVIGKGYVQGNVHVISRKANTMKSNATPLELIQFAEWIRRTVRA